MKTVALYVSVLFLCLACSTACERKPGRPNSPLCLFLSQAGIWECEDGSGRTTTEEPEALICTTIDGYQTWERYVDQKELRVRQLERELAQCRRR